MNKNVRKGLKPFSLKRGSSGVVTQRQFLILAPLGLVLSHGGTNFAYNHDRRIYTYGCSELHGCWRYFAEDEEPVTPEEFMSYVGHDRSYRELCKDLSVEFIIMSSPEITAKRRT